MTTTSLTDRSLSACRLLIDDTVVRIADAVRAGRGGVLIDLYFNLVDFARHHTGVAGAIPIILDEIKRLAGMTGRIMSAISVHLSNLDDLGLLHTYLLQIPIETLDWDRVFPALFRSQLVEALMMTPPSLPDVLRSLLFTVYWRQTLERLRGAVPPVLRPALFPDWLTTALDVDPTALDEDEHCPICLETFLMTDSETTDHQQPQQPPQQQDRHLDPNRPLIRLPCSHLYHQQCVACTIGTPIDLKRGGCVLCRMPIIPR